MMTGEYNDRTIIGLTEEIIFTGPDDRKIKVNARIDTGATKSSVDSALVDEMNLGPATGTKLVKQVHGHTIRPVVNAEFELAGKLLKEDFTVADRSQMKFRVLIGQNALKNGFLIDPHINKLG